MVAITKIARAHRIGCGLIKGRLKEQQRAWSAAAPRWFLLDLLHDHIARPAIGILPACLRDQFAFRARRRDDPDRVRMRWALMAGCRALRGHSSQFGIEYDILLMWWLSAWLPAGIACDGR